MDKLQKSEIVNHTQITKKVCDLLLACLRRLTRALFCVRCVLSQFMKAMLDALE